MDWKELSDVQGSATECLRTVDLRLHARSICNRSYYSAYSLVTAHLPDGIQFGRGWRNPEHAKLPGYVNQIGGLTENGKRRVKTAIRRLRQRREDADYRPGIRVNQADAREAIRDVEEIRRILT